MKAPLPAYFVADHGSETDGTLAAWCLYCETLHWHGAAGEGAKPRIEKRGAHCDAESGSPYHGGGYDLAVVGQAENEAQLMPDCLAVRVPPKPGHPVRPKLWRSLRWGREKIAQAVIAAIVDKVHGRPRFGPRLLRIFADGGWWGIVDRKGQPVRAGKGLIALAAAVYGVPVGVAALRLIEATNGLIFDPEMRQAIVALFEDWSERSASQDKGAHNGRVS